MDSFEKMKYMADNDLDICLAPVTNIVEWKKANGGAHVVIGVPESLLQRKLRGDVFCGGLVLMEKQQFDRVPFDSDKPKESVEAVIGDLQTLFGSYHKELDRLEEAKDGAYKERNMLLAGFCALAIAQGYRAFIMQHVGEEWDDDWRNIVCVELPTGQVTWHIHDSEMDLFKGLPYKDENVWDGHDTETKYQRVIALKYNVPKMMRDMAQSSDGRQ